MQMVSDDIEMCRQISQMFGEFLWEVAVEVDWLKNEFQIQFDKYHAVNIISLDQMVSMSSVQFFSIVSAVLIQFCAAFAIV